ncbi:MAG: GGDEF domain-containing protein [Betaproteobacteria bacterium]|nr:GGDEF domain-containing protein [Betaproteobacteria bacterium]
MAVMMVDMDRFKQVNDALGHRAGDVVLVQAARRIAACVRKADTVARHGGDELAIVMPGVRTAEDCCAVAAKVLQSQAVPFEVEGRDFGIGASIGVSLYPAGAGDGEALLRNADVAMYRAKQQGRNACLFYGNSQG